MCQLSLNLVNSNVSNKSKQQFILIDFSYYLLLYNNLATFFKNTVCSPCQCLCWVLFYWIQDISEGLDCCDKGLLSQQRGPKAEGAGRLSGGLRALEFSGYSVVVVPSEPDVANTVYSSNLVSV